MPRHGHPLRPLPLYSPTYPGTALQGFFHPLQGTSAGGHYSAGLLLHHAPEKVRPEGRGQGRRKGQTGGGRKRRGRAQAKGPHTGTEEPGLGKEGEYTVSEGQAAAAHCSHPRPADKPHPDRGPGPWPSGFSVCACGGPA